jgi:acyl carrier protein
MDTAKRLVQSWRLLRLRSSMCLSDGFIGIRRIWEMAPEEIREVIIEILGDIAPDEDLGTLDDAVAFREQLELDSMDFLDIVMELRKRYRVQIPEEEYVQLASMSSTVSYLTPKMAEVAK